MFSLFKSIFGAEKTGPYPESLIEAAIQRVIDGTDSRLRTLPGYRRALRDPVIQAIDAVVALVDRLPPPVAANRDDYSTDVRLSSLFASAGRMLDVFAGDDALREFRDSPASASGRAVALLTAQRIEKQVRGMQLEGDMVRRDVAQVAVSFSDHYLLAPAPSDAQAYRQIKRRAFDHLLSLGLSRIDAAESERADLSVQCALLRRKLKALQLGSLDFDASRPAGHQATALQAELDETESRLVAIGADERTLHAHLDIVVEVLADADRQLWLDDVELHLDGMNIRREPQHDSARRICLPELHNARGRRLVALPVSIALDELPPRDDFFTAAQRYLG